MSRIWLWLGSVVTIGVLGLTTFLLVNVVAHEETSRVERFPLAEVTALRLDNQHGSVVVETDPDADETVVSAEVDHGLRRTSLDIELVDGELVVDGRCPAGPPVWCRVDLRVVVHPETAVSVDNENGDVSISDVDGPVEVDTSNGPIVLARITGPLGVRTSNGPIDARGLSSEQVRARTSNGPIELSFAVDPSFVDASTSNGPVDIVVPQTEGVTYRLDLDTGFVGDTDAAVATDPTSARLVTARTSNGSITVRYPTG